MLDVILVLHYYVMLPSMLDLRIVRGDILCVHSITP